MIILDITISNAIKENSHYKNALQLYKRLCPELNAQDMHKLSLDKIEIEKELCILRRTISLKKLKEASNETGQV
jgi:hypothetical protein